MLSSEIKIINKSWKKGIKGNRESWPKKKKKRKNGREGQKWNNERKKSASQLNQLNQNFSLKNSPLKRGTLANLSNRKNVWTKVFFYCEHLCFWGSKYGGSVCKLGMCVYHHSNSFPFSFPVCVFPIFYHRLKSQLKNKTKQTMADNKYIHDDCATLQCGCTLESDWSEGVNYFHTALAL